MARANATQMVLVTTPDWDAQTGTLRYYERDGAGWKQVGTGFDVTVGRTGTAWGIGLHDARSDGPVKREGDGASPRGAFRLRGGYFRPDRFGVRPASPLPLRAIRPDDGWCDAKTDRRYNCPIRLPSPTSAESMWREDGLYDLVLDLDHNRGPIRPGAGSAIFMHIAREGFKPTEGCVALRPADLRRLLRRLGPKTRIVIGPVPARPKRTKGS